MASPRHLHDLLLTALLQTCPDKALTSSRPAHRFSVACTLQQDWPVLQHSTLTTCDRHHRRSIKCKLMSPWHLQDLFAAQQQGRSAQHPQQATPTTPSSARAPQGLPLRPQSWDNLLTGRGSGQQQSGRLGYSPGMSLEVSILGSISSRSAITMAIRVFGGPHVSTRLFF